MANSNHSSNNSSNSSSSNNNNHNQKANGRRQNQNNNNACKLSLMEISARVVAENIAFSTIEERYERIPEPVTRRIIYHSFPRDEKEIYMYSSLSTKNLDMVPFRYGDKILEGGGVENVLQVGFHLSGTIILAPNNSSNNSSNNNQPTHQNQNNTNDNNNQNSDNNSSTSNKTQFKVSLNFDRCKITATSCSCGSKDIFWCEHIVALALYRIRNAKTIKLRVPISETLLQMDRNQLQKLVQYLLSDHTDVLPTAQNLADEILLNSSSINKIAGAPDPTAGSAPDDEHCWYLDEEEVVDQVKTCLSQGGYYNANKQLNSLFNKVREMLKFRDTNGARLLTLITTEFLSDPRLIAWKVQGTPMADKHRQLWDQVGQLWTCVVLNPRLSSKERRHFHQLLIKFSQNSACPLEDPDVTSTSAAASSSSNSNNYNNHHGNNGSYHHHHHHHGEGDHQENLHINHPSSRHRKRARYSSHHHMGKNTHHHNHHHHQPRTIFSSGIELSNPNSPTNWRRGINYTNYSKTEDLNLTSKRVDALKSHGYEQEAINLSVSVVMNLAKYAARSNGIDNLDPIFILFDTLVEASCTNGIYSHCHIVVPGSSHSINNKQYTYLTLAYEASLKGLGIKRRMPEGLYAQEKICRMEEKLINKLIDLESKLSKNDEGILNDDLIIKVLIDQSREFLASNNDKSGFSINIEPSCVPMHTFAKYLFNVLIHHDSELAYTIGIRAIGLAYLDDWDNVEDLNVIRRYPRWFTLGHIEIQQCTLVSTLLNAAAKENSCMLNVILDNAIRHIHSSSHLFRLAQESFRNSGGGGTTVSGVVPVVTITTGGSHNDIGNNIINRNLLNVSYKLGLKTLKMTLNSGTRRRWEMVRWIVTCAIEMGFEALIHLLQNWGELFTPTEAAGSVASVIMSSRSTGVRLNLSLRDLEELAINARQLAVQCARKDPPNCALNALTLCENEPIAFETAYQIVIESASNNIMNSQQLFTIARYMEHRGYPMRAYKLALLAMENVVIGFNQDSHPAVNDIHWACGLSHSLGRTELGGIIPILVNKVQCATVLSEILKRCTLAAPLPPGQVYGELSSSGKSSRSSKMNKLLHYDRPPLKCLVDAAINSFINTIHSRLAHISPRHYTDFIEFLSKAKETFLMASDGVEKFQALIENIKGSYKGKKKLILCISERFGR